MRTLLLIATLILPSCMWISIPTFGYGAEWNEKPVMCGTDEEILGMLAEKNEMLVYQGTMFSKVRDPDEDDGLSITPAVLPLGIYMNLESSTFTVLEYHKAPYNIFCIIAYGTELEIINPEEFLD